MEGWGEGAISKQKARKKPSPLRGDEREGTGLSVAECLLPAEVASSFTPAPCLPVCLCWSEPCQQNYCTRLCHSLQLAEEKVWRGAIFYKGMLDL